MPRETDSRAPAGDEAPAWQVYIVICADGSLYTGISSDVPGRLRRHNAGAGSRYTRSRRPVKLAWTEPAGDRSAALKREARIKAMSRGDKLKLIASVRGARRRSGPGTRSGAP